MCGKCSVQKKKVPKEVIQLLVIEKSFLTKPLRKMFKTFISKVSMGENKKEPNMLQNSFTLVEMKRKSSQ